MTSPGATKDQYEEMMFDLELEHGTEMWWVGIKLESDDAGLVAGLKVKRGVPRPKLKPPSHAFRLVVYEVLR